MRQLTMIERCVDRLSGADEIERREAERDWRAAGGEGERLLCRLFERELDVTRRDQNGVRYVSAIVGAPLLMGMWTIVLLTSGFGKIPEWPGIALAGGLATWAVLEWRRTLEARARRQLALSRIQTVDRLITQAAHTEIVPALVDAIAYSGQLRKSFAIALVRLLP